MNPARGLKTVAALEAAKGMLVLGAGLGLLSLMHRDIEVFAEQLLAQFHLNPANRYPRIFLDAIDRISDMNFVLLALAAATYAALRFAEAYGLWRGRRWAEWLAVVSGGIYVPIELYKLSEGVNAPKLVLLAVNVGIVLYLARALRIQKGAPR